MAPELPSIFQTEPGPPPLGTPNWPGIQRAPRSPLTSRGLLSKRFAGRTGTCHVDIGAAIGRVAIERDAEHLADISRGRLEGRRGVGQCSGSWASELCQIEHPQHGAAGVDQSDIGGRHVRRNVAPHFGAGKAGDRGVALADDGRALGRVRCDRRQGERHQEKRCNPVSSNLCARDAGGKGY